MLFTFYSMAIFSVLFIFLALPSPIRLLGSDFLIRQYLSQVTWRIQNSNILTTWYEKLTHWKRPWCWGKLRAEGEGGGRGWIGWMASPTQWTWAWANSGRWGGQGSLVCCRPWGCKESDMTERLNNKHFGKSSTIKCKILLVLWSLLPLLCYA